MEKSSQVQALLKILPDPRNGNDASVDRLFNAVFCLLVEKGFDIIAEGLLPGDVADRAGKARSGYYRTPGFPSENATLGEVDRHEVLAIALDRAINDVDLEDRHVVRGIKTYLAGLSDAASFHDAMETILHLNFGGGTPKFVAYLLCAALAPNSESAAETLTKYFDYVTDTYEGVMIAASERFGLRPLPPFTTKEATMLMSALHDGLALRGMVDDASNKDLYARAGLALLGMLLGPDDEVDRVVTEFDPVTDTRPPSQKSRHQIVIDVRRHLTRHAPAVPDMETISRAVSCSPQTLAALFGGLRGLLMEVWRDFLPPLYETHHHGRGSGKRGTAAQLRAHLVGIGTVIDENIALATGLARLRTAVFAGQLSEDRLAGSLVLEDTLLVEIVRALRDEGGLVVPRYGHSDEVTAIHEFCAVLQRSLIDIIVQRRDPSGSSRTDIDECVSYLWDVMIDR